MKCLCGKNLSVEENESYSVVCNYCNTAYGDFNSLEEAENFTPESLNLELTSRYGDI